jgi:hypothetical protein
MFVDDNGIWGAVVVIGPIALALVIAWAMFRNRGATKHEIERTEAATRAMYDEQNREDIARDDR